MIDIKVFFSLLNVAGFIFFYRFKLKWAHTVFIGFPLSDKSFLDLIVFYVELTLH